MTPSDPIGYWVSKDDIEALKADRDRLAERVRELSEMLGKCDAERSLAVLEREELQKRLATYADERKRFELAMAALKQADESWLRCAERLNEERQKLATAETDNAALLKYIKNSACDLGCKSDEREGIIVGDVSRCDRCTILTSAHPGTALAQRLAMMEEALKEAYQGLHLAGIICDAVPTRAHELKDNETLKDLGLRVNQGQYQIIRDAEQKAQQALEGK